MKKIYILVLAGLGGTRWLWNDWFGGDNFLPRCFELSGINPFLPLLGDSSSRPQSKSSLTSSQNPKSQTGDNNICHSNIWRESILSVGQLPYSILSFTLKNGENDKNAQSRREKNGGLDKNNDTVVNITRKENQQPFLAKNAGRKVYFVYWHSLFHISPQTHSFFYWLWPWIEPWLSRF